MLEDLGRRINQLCSSGDLIGDIPKSSESFRKKVGIGAYMPGFRSLTEGLLVVVPFTCTPFVEDMIDPMVSDLIHETLRQG